MAKAITFRSRKAAIASVIQKLDDKGSCDKTGIPKLDKVMAGGMYAGKSYGIQARKKIGKSILLGTISYNLNMAGVKHVWIAAEMTDRELEERQVARALGRDSTDFLRGQIATEDVSEYLSMAPDNMLYTNASGISLPQLEDTIDRAVKEHNVNGIILDYLQLVKGVSANRTEHLEYVAQSIASKTKEHDIWALVAAQLNQDNNTRGGEGMLLAFDMVFNLHREKTQREAWLEMTESRYTAYMNIGSRSQPGLRMEPTGPYFSQI
jgi:replicative DNA helicase